MAKQNIITRSVTAIKSRYEKLVSPWKQGNKRASAFFGPRNSFLWNLFAYNGEKNLGELGPTKDYLLDYGSLRSRGNQLYLDNEVAQTIINRMVAWVIGNGLTLESEPNEIILKSEGIALDIQAFTDLVEARFNTLKECKQSTFARMKNLSELETTAFISSSNGGGILVVLRVKNAIVNYEIIDGAHVRHWAGGTDLNPTLLDNGNRIAHGIEMNDAGEHVAFWVLKANNDYQEIRAKSRTTGLTMAFMYGGAEYRIDNSRTIPVLAGLFQSLTQMDEYKTATLGSAKEQNAVAYQTVSEIGATGENPFGAVLARAQDANANDGTLAVDSQLKELANTVQVSMNKQTFHNPVGTKIETLKKNEAELYFKDFWSTLFEVGCAAANIPPNVAMQRFDTSFSSARAAIKDWEHSLILKRYKHGMGFLQPGYELQLHLDILTGKVQAPGYLTAFTTGNTLVLAAYRHARWVGDNVPHIDPVKEVQAERLKLGDAGANMPLTTQKKSTEALNGGSSKNNTDDFAKELEIVNSKKIKPLDPPAPAGGPPNKD